jgi:hypothetical protein
MNRWTATVPTVRSVDGHHVHGTQTWIVTATSYADAAHEARVYAITDRALRHRRGAAIDLTALTITLWTGAELMGGSML